VLASSSTIVVWSQVHCVFRGLRIQLYYSRRRLRTVSLAVRCRARGTPCPAGSYRLQRTLQMYGLQ
jgi:hypothetical protein